MLVIQGRVGGESTCAALFGEHPDAAWQLASGEGWVLRMATDFSHVLERTSDGWLIRDKRQVEGEPGDDTSLNGAFLCVRASDPGVLEITTDRIGSIPIYVASAKGCTMFSSRLLDLARAGWRTPNPLGIHQWVLLGQPLGSETALEGVALLPHASVVDVDRTGYRVIRKYWTPCCDPDPDGPIGRYLDEAIDRLRMAHQRCAPAPDQLLAMPVTGGFDSRCNLALWDTKVEQSILFHTEDLGNYELPIARLIAARYGKQMAVYSSKDWMVRATRLDLSLETGEFNAAHWRLADTARRLAKDYGAQATIDGFFQDFLFKASFVSDAPAEALFRSQMEMARYRARFLDVDGANATMQALEASVERATLTHQDGWSATQNYYIDNRSRRLVYNIVRLNQNYLDVKTPGMDHELIDFGLSLPKALRKNALLYRHIINKLDPRMAEIRYDKSGLPLMDMRKRSWSRRLKGPIMRNLNHVFPDRRIFRESETNFAKLLRESAQFRKDLDSHIGASKWIEALFGKKVIERLDKHRRKGRPIDDMVGVLVTLAALELQSR